jgi:hypothetical protein
MRWHVNVFRGAGVASVRPSTAARAPRTSLHRCLYADWKLTHIVCPKRHQVRAPFVVRAVLYHTLPCTSDPAAFSVGELLSTTAHASSPTAAAASAGSRALVRFVDSWHGVAVLVSSRAYNSPRHDVTGPSGQRRRLV